MYPMGEGGIIWMLLMAVVVVVPFWQICTKAGYSAWLSLLILVPLLNLGLLYFLAFADWPRGRQAETK